jgi:DNA-binding transcriptional regulator of glucitol operon
MGTPAANGAAAAPPGPVWRFLLQPRWLAWHATMVVSFWGMLWLGDWQFRRAMSGNGLSWAYTFEWPLFAVFAVVFWAKTLRDEVRIRSGKIPDPKLIRELEAAAAEARTLAMIDPNRPKAITAGPEFSQLGLTQAEDWNRPEDEPEDEELAKYNAYLARLHLEVKDHGKWHGLR